MANLFAIQPFECEGESTSVGTRWEKWLRSFEIYLEASNIKQPSTKRATLLHSGGSSLQEIYYNLPGAHAEPKNDDGKDVDVYKIAVQKLNEYFYPKQSKIYERHLFRLTKQEEGEKFEKFLVRLRNQAAKCNFTNPEEHLIDQIVEKCTSVELRKKILLVGDSINLHIIISEANALEAVNRQLEGFVDQKQKSLELNHVSRDNRSRECCRCGGNHTSNFPKCPAKLKTCSKCGYKGHYQKYCRTNPRKRHRSYDTLDGARDKRSQSASYQKARKITSNSSRSTPDEEIDNMDEEKIDYVFHIDNDTVITCNLGGIPVDMLIDSGSNCNILDDGTWSCLKRQNIKVCEQVKNPSKLLFAYGSKIPLNILGSFKAEISVGGNSEIATIYVIKNGSRCLLGKTTAIALGVLKIGLGINYIGPFPKFKGVLVDIPIDKSITPVSQPYRRIPIPLESKVTEKLQELVAADIIEVVNGHAEWVSPIVPVLKGNGEVRICLDMRRANEAIMRENHPLPTMDTLLPHFRKANIFSRLDIKNAFHQIEISESSRYITTFITNKGLFRYKRLMFGISCAPEIFQKTLERILQQCEGTINFIDDILVYGRNLEEHNQRLEKTLHVLESNNVFLNRDKCIYRINKIEFLGHELSPQGIKPLESHVKVIQNFRAPRTVDEIQSFLGLVNFLGKWIANLATLTEPIREILRLKLGKHANIEKFWKDKQNQAFFKLKEALLKIETLGYYDPKDKTQVIADASPVGLGAVLLQYDHFGPRVIAYGNKSLSDCEKRYCQTEKEALALVWSVEHFKIYLYGKRFELITDHKPLEIIFGRKSKPCARIERWVLRLQSFDFKVVYKPGKSNIADPLSRLCKIGGSTPYNNEDYVQQIVEYARPKAVTLSEINEHSSTDSEIQNVKQGVFQNIWNDTVLNFKVFQAELCFYKNILLRGNKLVIPRKLRHVVLKAAHEGHPGIVAMKHRLRTKVWWPKIDHDAEELVRKCNGCTLVSAPSVPEPMKRRELPLAPWIDVAIDFMGPLPSGDYLFVMVDYFSRYKEVKIMRNITAANTIRIMEEIFSRLGYPVSITADNGRQFTSEEFKAFCEERGITIFHSVPYWPQQNGEVERQNKDILKRLRISQAAKTNWRQELVEYLIMYNSTPHTTTGKTPSELFFRRQFRDKIPTLCIPGQLFSDEEVRDKDRTQKEKGKQYSDRKRKARESDIQIGDKVYVKNMTKDNKITPTFDSTPHEVVAKYKGDVQVKDITSGQERRRNIIHLKKIGNEWKVTTSENRDE